MNKKEINADVLFRNASELTTIFSNPISTWDSAIIDVLEYKLDYLKLFFTSRRPYKVLLENGFSNQTTLREIISCGRQHFIDMKGFGKKNLENLEEAMDMLGVNWNTDVELYDVKKIVQERNGVRDIQKHIMFE